MGKIIRFRGDRHRQTQEALPWYVTDQLDDGERADVETHLADCEACRRELETERDLARQVVDLPLNADASWEAVRRRMRPRSRSSKLQGLADALQRTFARPTRLGWVVAAQALVLAAAGVAYTALPQRVPAAYHTLSAPPAYGAGNVIAIFRPDISEEHIRATLIANHARVVDGPTASGAYVLRVPDADRPAILADLQQNEEVVLAQPIDAGPAQ
jgi:anti-sigma factor RsiW